MASAQVPSPPSRPPSPKLFEQPVADDAEAAEELIPKKARFWMRSEFLLWWIKTANLPPLVTTGDFTEARPGALDSLSTQILFGGASTDFQHRTGGRFTGGYWFDDEQDVGIDAGYFFVGGRALGQTFTSPGNPVLAVPFFNTSTGMQDSSLVTYPGIMSGSVSVAAMTFLQGADANLSKSLWQSEHCRLTALGGFRWVGLTEGVEIDATSLVQLAPQFQGFGIPFDGNTILVKDRFDTRNNFYGGQLGMRFDVQRKRFTLELLGKVALGVTNQAATIHGFTGIDTQPPVAVPAGLYAVGSNSGTFTRNVFGVVPEVGANLKFQLTEHIHVFGGYSFTYWNNVARPGDLIDQAVNPNQVPTSATFGATGGPARPGFQFHSSSFFAQGANFGMEFRW